MRFLAFVGAVFAASLWCAGSAGATSPFIKYKGTIKFAAGGPSFASGPCTVAPPTARLCPSNDCQCVTGSGSYSGSAGKGSATFSETIDTGDGNSPDSGGGPGCGPATGLVTITGAKDNDESFIFSGGSCINADGTSYIAGGCVMASSTLFGQGAVVSCTLTTTAKGAAKLVLKGAGERPK